MLPAIKVQNLGKEYVIGSKEKGNETFREMLLSSLSAPFRRFTQSDGKSGQEERFWALKDVSFEVQPGEVVGIIGRNGAGKSTLLKILSRITEPTQGEISIRGRVASLLEVGTGFHPELTGRENIYLNGAILGMSRAEIKRKFDEIVDFSEVEKFLDTPVKHYSSGMYVRLAFAVAAHLEPEILVVDEVLAVGDAEFQKKCLGKMGDVAKQGRTVLFVSHNMGAVKSLCGKCILLKEGRLSEYGDVNQVVMSYLNAGENRSVVEITPKMRNRGNGQVVFKSCTLNDMDGVATNSFLIGQNFVIEITLDIQHTNNLYFWLIIFDSEGRPVLSSHQGDIEMIKVEPGSFKLRCNTQQIGLMPGNYTISAGAFDAGRTFLEWIDNCQSFEVFPTFVGGKAFDHRWGAMNLNMKWELSDDGQ